MTPAYTPIEQMSPALNSDIYSKNRLSPTPPSGLLNNKARITKEAEQ